MEMKKISNYIGRFPKYVQGGGGNTSFKIDDVSMLIKASGYLLSEVNVYQGYVPINYKKILNKIQDVKKKNLHQEELFNEYLAKNKIKICDMDISNLRPSIETGFHALLNKCVIHSHSVYANLLNCSLEGEKILNKIFLEDEFIYVDYHSPGLGLTLAIKEKINTHRNNYNKTPKIIFLENHGLIVNEIDAQDTLDLHEKVNEKIKDYFSIINIYPEIKVKKISSEKWVIKEGYILNTIKSLNLDLKYFSENILFPDQVVYFDNNVSFVENYNKKINILKDKIVYRVNSKKEVMAINDTLLAYVFILEKIKKLGLNDRFIKSEEKSYIENMRSEKHRKIMLK